MFTGLIKEIGKIKSVTRNQEGAEISIHSKKLLKDIQIDDSVAVNGVCQTVTIVGEDYFTVQAVHTTLEKTNFKTLQVGQEVNMELALTLADRLGGHIVQGHVNGIAPITGIKAIGNNYLISITVDDNLMKYIVSEGSITIDGISLTVATLKGNKATMSVIPHTFNNTILKNKRMGSYVNIEVDVIAKYVENLLKYQNKNSSKITDTWIREQGF